MSFVKSPTQWPFHMYHGNIIPHGFQFSNVVMRFFQKKRNNRGISSGEWNAKLRKMAFVK